MSRKNQHTLSKRQREQKRAEKVAHKQARREERKDPETRPAGAGDVPAEFIAATPPA
jgi:hypothetical protein